MTTKNQRKITLLFRGRDKGDKGFRSQKESLALCLSAARSYSELREDVGVGVSLCVVYV
jgi:hypothetical protein